MLVAQSHKHLPRLLAARLPHAALDLVGVDEAALHEVAGDVGHDGTDRVAPRALGVLAVSLDQYQAANVHVARPDQAEPFSRRAHATSHLGNRLIAVVERPDRLEDASVVTRRKWDHASIVQPTCSPNCDECAPRKS